MKDYLTTNEAAELSGVSRSTILCRLQPDKQRPSTKTRNRICNYYLKDKVAAFAEERNVLVQSGKKKAAAIDRHTVKRCTCGAIFEARPYQRVCEECEAAKTRGQDPFDIRIKPKFGTRRCKACGKLIEIGRYRCPCHAKRDAGHGTRTLIHCDDDFAGGCALR